MRINIEAQRLCVPSDRMRGIPYYVKHLVENLIKRNTYRYALSFFDYQKEKGNRGYLKRNLENFIEKVDLYECNCLSYRDIMYGMETGCFSVYDGKPYDYYIGGASDVYHIPHFLYMPVNLQGAVVTTVHDIIPLTMACGEDTIKEVDIYKRAVDYLKGHDSIEIIADSESTKSDLINLGCIKEERIRVIPLGVDQTECYVDNNSDILGEMGIKQPYLLYIGAFDLRKGILNIIDAFEIIKERFPEVKLVLAGNANRGHKKIKLKIMMSKNYDDIILPGFITGKQKRILLSSAEMFLFPAEYEGFGLPVLEAMACGCPVITTNVSSLTEVGGNAVHYVGPENVSELAENILYLLEEEKVRKKLREMGLERVNMFSWDKTAELTEQVYQKAFLKRG